MFRWLTADKKFQRSASGREGEEEEEDGHKEWEKGVGMKFSM